MSSVPDTITSFTVVTYSASTVTLSWDTVTNTGDSAIEFYKIYNDDDSPAGDQIPIANVTTQGTTISFVLIGLTHSTAYNIYITAVNADSAESTASIGVTFTTLSNSPDVPTDLSTSDATGTTVTLSWNAPSYTGSSSISYYKVYSIAGGYITSTSGNSNTYIIVDNLTYNTAYEFYVTALNTDGIESSASGSASATTRSGSPDPPTDLSTSNITTTSIDLSWTAPTYTGNSAIDYYKVYYADGTIAGTTDGTSDTSISISGLTADTSYDFYVITLNTDSNESGASGSAGATTASASPDPPTDLSTSNITTTSIDLSWNTPSYTGSSAISFYNIYYADGSSAGTTDGTSDTSITITSLTHNTSYDFYVTAINADGNESGGSGSVNATTLSASPDPPTDLSTSNITSTSIDLSWTAPSYTGSSAIDYYKIYYADGTFITDTSGTSDTSITITSLTANTSYDFYVSAINTDTYESGGSGSVNASTLQGVTSKPLNLRATANSTVADLSWDVPETIDSAILFYRINYSYIGSSLSNGENMVVGDNVITNTVNTVDSSLTYTLEGLTNNRYYTITVEANNEFGYSAPSDPIDVYPGVLPDPVENVVAELGSNACVSHPWTPGNSSLIVSWDTLVSSEELNPITGYTVTAIIYSEVMQDPPPPYTITSITVNSNISTMLFPCLFSQTTYIFDVAAINLTGLGSSSSSSSQITTPATTGVGTFIAVGYSADSSNIPIIRSTDTSNWNAATSSTFSNYTSSELNNCVAGNGYLWVSVGANNYNTISIQTSSDGLIWTDSATAGAGNNPFSGGVGNGVAWNGSYWCAVGYNDTNTVSIASSSDGNYWVDSVGGGGNNPFGGGVANDIAWNGGYWCAVGHNGDNSVHIATSFDGINWTPSSNDPFYNGSNSLNYNVKKIVWNGSYWCSICDGNSSATGNTIAISSNGSHWIVANSNIYGTARGLAYGNGLWMASFKNIINETTNTNVLVTSPNGLDWIIKESCPFNNPSGSKGGEYLGDIGAVFYNYTDEVFYVSGLSEVSDEYVKIVYTDDGTNWTDLLLQTNENKYNSIAYSVKVNTNTLPAVPSAPRNITVAPKVASVLVSWDTPTYQGSDPILGYMISSIPTNNAPQIVDASYPSTLMTGLKNGTSYNFIVLASNIVGYSGTTNAIRPYPLPGNPIISSIVTQNQVELLWTAVPSSSNSPITGYLVTCTNSNIIIPTISGGGNSNSCVIDTTPVALRTSLAFRIKSVSDIGESLGTVRTIVKL